MPNKSTPLHQTGTGTGSTPIPDPTVLTGQLVDKAISALKETIDVRLTGIDRSVAQLERDVRSRPEAVEEQIRHLEKLINERFNTVGEQFKGIQVQFDERDTRVRESAQAATTAINAALQAQKDAAVETAKSFTLSIDKSEKGTLEQIAQQRLLLESTSSGIRGNIDDLKDRLTRIEGAAVGRITEKTEEHQSSSYVLALIMGLVTVVSVVFAIVVAVVR